MKNDPAKTTIADGVAEILLDHPPVNAFDAAGWERLAEIIREGMELRAQRNRPALTFVGSIATGRPGHRTAESASDLRPAPRSWR